MSSPTQTSLKLMQTIIEYRPDEATKRQLKAAGKCSMLHPDVLILVHYFARTSAGGILEIGSFVGGCTIAAGLGLRASGKAKRFLSLEPGGRLTGHPLATRDIFEQLRKNLKANGVLDQVTLLQRMSHDPAAISEVRAAFPPRSVSLFIFDADAAVGRDLERFGGLLQEGCWLVIDDYFGSTEKAGPTRAQVDEWVGRGRLLPLGYYGWGTWVGQWQG